MAIDTFIAIVGVYENDADAEADYQLVKDLHVEAGLMDAYDAAVISRGENGKVKITKKHETPTRVGGVWAAVSASRPGSSSHCSRSRRSAEDCSGDGCRRRACSAPWPDTRRWG